MRLLHKAVRLVKLSEVSQRRSEASIGHLQEQMDEIASRIAAHDTQGELLRNMMQQQQQPCLMNRAGLFAVQQRNAVCRQKLQALGLERVELQEEYNLLREEQEEARLTRLHWQRKGDKYQRCVHSERQQMRLTQALREESEIQEKYSWRK